MLSVVLHGQSGEQTGLPVSTDQHHQRADSYTGLVSFSHVQTDKQLCFITGDSWPG